MFIGLNPHPGCHKHGVPFSNNKAFWYQLSLAGLIDENEAELRQPRTLADLYNRKLTAEYGLSFINLVRYPTRRLADLKRGDEIPGVKTALRAIRRYQPKIVCFIGKTTFNWFRKRPKCDYGWQ